MGNTQYRNYSDWKYNGNKTHHMNYGSAQGPIMLAYGATMPTSQGPTNSFEERGYKLIGGAQNLAKKNEVHYLYGKVIIPNRKYEYIIITKDEKLMYNVKQDYKLIGNEIIFPKNMNMYLVNRYRTIIKSKNWDYSK
jgi:hypothetical protein